MKGISPRTGVGETLGKGLETEALETGDPYG